MNFDKNIPLPTNSGAGRPRTNAVYLMDIGDSFFTPVSDKQEQHSIRTKAINAAKYVGFKVLTRKVIENGEIGIRIWRKA